MPPCLRYADAFHAAAYIIDLLTFIRRRNYFADADYFRRAAMLMMPDAVYADASACYFDAISL